MSRDGAGSASCAADPVKAYLRQAMGGLWTDDATLRAVGARRREGREAAFDAVDVFDLRDGRIGALSTWYDLVAARRAVTG